MRKELNGRFDLFSLKMKAAEKSSQVADYLLVSLPIKDVLYL